MKVPVELRPYILDDTSTLAALDLSFSPGISRIILNYLPRWVNPERWNKEMVPYTCDYWIDAGLLKMDPVFYRFDRNPWYKLEFRRLCMALEHGLPLKTLLLRECKLANCQLLQIIEALRYCRTLTHLDLRFNVCSLSSVRRLAVTLPYWPSLRVIRFGGISMTDWDCARRVARRAPHCPAKRILMEAVECVTDAQRDDI